MYISFLGGAGERNRSCFLLEINHTRLLIDCGINMEGEDVVSSYPHKLHQLAPSIDAVFLTHAHPDHCCALPYLIEHGFNGSIYASSPIWEQIPRMWTAWESVLQPELRRPLIDYYQKRQWLPLLLSKRYTWHRYPGEDISFQFGKSAHALGSLWFIFSTGQQSVFISGDYQMTSPQINFDMPQEKVDVAIIDGAYGENSGQTVLDTDIHSEELPVAVPLRPHGKGLSYLIESLRKGTLRNRKIYICTSYQKALQESVYFGEWVTDDTGEDIRAIEEQLTPQWQAANIIFGTKQELEQLLKEEHSISPKFLIDCFVPVHPYYEETRHLLKQIQPALTCIIHADMETSWELGKRIQHDTGLKTIQPQGREIVDVSTVRRGNT